MIEPGDTVQTTSQIYFLEATNPDTGEQIETMLPKRHHLKVITVNQHTVTVQLPNGFQADLDKDDVAAP